MTRTVQSPKSHGATASFSEVLPSRTTLKGAMATDKYPGYEQVEDVERGLLVGARRAWMVVKDRTDNGTSMQHPFTTRRIVPYLTFPAPNLPRVIGALRKSSAEPVWYKRAFDWLSQPRDVREVACETRTSLGAMATELARLHGSNGSSPELLAGQIAVLAFDTAGDPLEHNSLLSPAIADALRDSGLSVRVAQEITNRTSYAVPTRIFSGFGVVSDPMLDRDPSPAFSATE